jgi:hypothetical protein
MSGTRIGLAAIAAVMIVTPAQAGDTKKVVKNAAIGAAVGAGTGVIVPGLSVKEGAIIGGVGGAVVGAIDKDRKYHRDAQGRRYYVDGNGRRRYVR